MKKPSPIIKLLTLVFFVLVLTGFVSYRAGLFSKKSEPEPKETELTDEEWDMIMGSSKSAEVFPDEMMELQAQPSDSPPPVKPEGDPDIFYGTKSGKVVDFDTGLFNIMPSSKSGGVFDDIDWGTLFDTITIDSSLFAPTEENAPEDKVIMGGSKSDIIFDPPENEPDQDFTPNQAPNQHFSLRIRPPIKTHP